MTPSLTFARQQGTRGATDWVSRAGCCSTEKGHTGAAEDAKRRWGGGEEGRGGEEGKGENTAWSVIDTKHWLWQQKTQRQGVVRETEE